MSVLTKVFVVLLTLVSIALSMLVVSAFARQEDWRASAIDWRATALAAQAKEKAISQNAALEQARAQDRHQKDVTQIADLQAKMADQERAISELERKAAEAENRLTVEQGTSAALAEQSKVFQADVTKEREFSGKLAKRNSELERQSIDQTDRIKELTANMAMAQAQVRALQQQLAAAGSRAPAGTAAAAGNIVEANVPSVQPSAAPEVTAPIRGEVTSIKGALAEISVGSADGVAAGMRFLIYRPGQKGAKPQYLGMLRITRVEQKQAAGQVEQSEGDIKAGDSVRDEASFAMRG
ncbi:MAG TPA: hypothetical protein VMV94_12330 [Phycisphaerae bacterium]|nr:hypothetical protein [Phycisphaerae bacterium]